MTCIDTNPSFVEYRFFYRALLQKRPMSPHMSSISVQLTWVLCHCCTMCCSVLQCVAVCCSVLQRVAACCSADTDSFIWVIYHSYEWQTSDMTHTLLYHQDPLTGARLRKYHLRPNRDLRALIEDWIDHEVGWQEKQKIHNFNLSWHTFESWNTCG